MPADLTIVFRQFLDSRSESSFRRLYAEMTPSLYGFVFYRLDGDAARAQDATQETWCRVVSQADRYGGRSAVSTWILGIALNVCREMGRDRPPAQELSEDAIDVHNPDVASTIDLARGLGHLADGYREVLLLHDVVGLTHDEIAQLLGIDIGTSKSQLSRARSRLVSHLGDKTTEARIVR